MNFQLIKRCTLAVIFAALILGAVNLVFSGRHEGLSAMVGGLVAIFIMGGYWLGFRYLHDGLMQGKLLFIVFLNLKLLVTAGISYALISGLHLDLKRFALGLGSLLFGIMLSPLLGRSSIERKNGV